MRIADSIKLSLRMFKTRPSRTCLTILGMGVGTGAVLFLIGLGYGFQNLLLANIVSSDTLLSLTITSAQPDVIILNETKIKELYDIKAIQDISPVVSYPGQLSWENLIGNVVLKGVDSDYFKYEGIGVISGSSMDEQKKELLVSEAVVMLFGAEEPKEIIGTEVGVQVFGALGEETEGKREEFVQFEGEYKIVGVVEGVESVFIFFPLKDLKSKIEIAEYESAKVRVKKEADIGAVTDALLDQGFQVSSLSETVEQANKIFRGVQVALGLFGAIALFVAAIGMVNTMTVTLLERTNEIGIMRATGASKKDILILFVSEATVMGFLGGVSGLIIGVLGGKIFNWIINMLATMFGGKAVNLFLYPLWFVVSLIMVSTFVGLVAGFFPGRRAAKLDPLDALRYK